MKIGVTGCSNSSFNYGNPWHYYMGEKYNAEIISSSSPGAGNEMNIEKIKFILENNKLDLFVVQLTQPERLVMGINEPIDVQNGHGLVENFHHGNFFNGDYYYSFNAYSNENNLKKIFKKNILIDEFMINNIITSRYNSHIKLFQTMTKFF